MQHELYNWTIYIGVICNHRDYSYMLYQYLQALQKCHTWRSVTSCCSEPSDSSTYTTAHWPYEHMGRFEVQNFRKLEGGRFV